MSAFPRARSAKSTIEGWTHSRLSVVPGKGNVADHRCCSGRNPGPSSGHTNTSLGSTGWPFHRSVTPPGSAWSSSALGKISRRSPATASISSAPTKPSIRIQPSSRHVVTSASVASREVTMRHPLPSARSAVVVAASLAPLLPGVGEHRSRGQDQIEAPDAPSSRQAHPPTWRAGTSGDRHRPGDLRSLRYKPSDAIRCLHGYLLLAWRRRGRGNAGRPWLHMEGDARHHRHRLGGPPVAGGRGEPLERWAPALKR